MTGALTDPSLAFARHFAHLVWLLVYEAGAHEAQVLTLRALTNAPREGAVRLAAIGGRLLVNEAPATESFHGSEEVLERLSAVGVTHLTIDAGVAPAELLALAQLLAAAPQTGADLRALDATLRALGGRCVHISAAMTDPTQGDASAAGLGSLTASLLDPMAVVMAQLGYAEELSLQPKTPARGTPAPGVEADVVQTADTPQFLMSLASEMPKGDAPKHTLDHLFQELDKAGAPHVAGKVLDAIAALAVESMRKERAEMVADIAFGLLHREARIRDADVRILHVATIRRLLNPRMLGCVASLLPHRPENQERYLTILRSAEESGAEALIDALCGAQSIAERRVYFDALAKLRVGTRALVHMLGDSRWYVVRNAADLLGEMRATDAEPALIRLMDYPDERVRTSAASALAKFGTASAVKALRLALRDATPEVRDRAADALVTDDRRRSATSLIRALEAEGNPRVQVAVITALGQLATPEAVSKLIDVARNEGRSPQKTLPLRVAAIHALGETRTPAAMAAIQSLTHDKTRDVRGAASWVMMGRRREGERPRR